MTEIALKYFASSLRNSDQKEKEKKKNNNQNGNRKAFCVTRERNKSFLCNFNFKSSQSSDDKISHYY